MNDDYIGCELTPEEVDEGFRQQQQDEDAQKERIRTIIPRLYNGMLTERDADEVVAALRHCGMI